MVLSRECLFLHIRFPWVGTQETDSMSSLVSEQGPTVYLLARALVLVPGIRFS